MYPTLNPMPSQANENGNTDHVFVLRPFLHRKGPDRGDVIVFQYVCLSVSLCLSLTLPLSLPFVLYCGGYFCEIENFLFVSFFGFVFVYNLPEREAC